MSNEDDANLTKEPKEDMAEWKKEIAELKQHIYLQDQRMMKLTQDATASELRDTTERTALLESEIVQLKGEVKRLQGLIMVRHCKTLLLQELRATYKAFPSLELYAGYEGATNLPRT